MTKPFVLIAVISLLNLVGCSSSDDSAAPTVARQAFTAAESALKTAGQSLDNSASSLSRSGKVSARDFDDHCTGMGTTADSSADYIACILTRNDGSPETTLGALNLARNIVNGVESRVVLTYPASPRTTEDITFTVETADGTYTVNASVVDKAGDGSPWTNHLDVCMFSITLGSSVTNLAPNLQSCIDNGFSVSISIMRTTTALAFKNVVRFTGDYEASLFHLDSESDTMRFESFSLANGNHTRAYIEGNVSLNLALDSISQAEFASAYYQDTGGGNFNWGALYATYDGSAICMNYQQDQNPQTNQQDNQLSVGTCGAHPTYNAVFHDFTTGGFEAWADDNSKGLLSFTDSTFAINSFFINQ